MNCDELKKSIYDYVEKKLPDGERADFEQHEGTCEPCGNLLAEIRKLTCKQFVDFLNDYFENELPAEQRATFDRHMELCPPCKDYLRSYEATVQLGHLACTEDGQVSPDVPETLVRAILRARLEK
jgi:anti-sigma factor RsiW